MPTAAHISIASTMSRTWATAIRAWCGAAAGQMARLNTNTRYLDEHLVEYIERLTATLPPPLSVVYLVCSGSEANELALRLARAHTGRDSVVVVETAYHGNTNALIDISPYKFDGPGGRGKPAHVDGAADARRDAMARCRPRSPGAFICESALSCAGQVILPPGYLRDVYEAVARGRRRLHRRRSADRLRPRRLALLDVRDAGRRARHRHARQAHRQWPSDGRGDHDARDRGVLRQRHGVLQHLRRQSGLVRRRPGGARRHPRRRLAGECAR